MRTSDIFKPYMKVPDKEKAHAPLSASGAERWTRCLGSVGLIERLGLKSIENEWSKTGTNAHTLLQFILENKEWKLLLAHKDATPFKKFITYSDEQLDSVLTAANFVWDEMKRMPGYKLRVEQKVELQGVGFGTADIILYKRFGILHVMDYKNGRSIVEAKANTQGLYYAAAAYDTMGEDFSEIWITIIQPNASHGDGAIRTWKTTPKVVERAGEFFRESAKLTKKKDAPLVVGDKHCWFCPAREKHCPEQLRLKSTKIMDRFERRP